MLRSLWGNAMKDRGEWEVSVRDAAGVRGARDLAGAAAVIAPDRPEGQFGHTVAVGPRDKRGGVGEREDLACGVVLTDHGRDTELRAAEAIVIQPAARRLRGRDGCAVHVWD